MQEEKQPVVPPCKATNPRRNPTLERVLIALTLTVACVVIDVLAWPLPVPIILMEVGMIGYFTAKAEIIFDSQ